MTYPISEIDGLTAYSASKLKSQGIRTTEGLLEATRTVKGRKALAAKTGISERRRHHGTRTRAAQSGAAGAEHERSEYQA
jgi:hypothetical protein